MIELLLSTSDCADSALCVRIEPVHDVADVYRSPVWAGGGRMSERYN